MILPVRGVMKVRVFAEVVQNTSRLRTASRTELPKFRMFRSRTFLTTTNLYGYRHLFRDGHTPKNLPSLPSKIVCVAKNFASSHDELHKARSNLDAARDQAMIFSKNLTSLISFDEPILLEGRKDIHYETELALLIGKSLHVSPSGHDPLECVRSVIGLGIALDLTSKDIQNRLKGKGGPWELAKGFDRACPLSAFERADGTWWEQDRTVTLEINGKIVQQQKTSEILLQPGDLISYITRFISLIPGDLILTGTPMLPEPTQPLQPKHMLTASITGLTTVKTQVF